MEHYEKKISFLGENIQTIRKHRGMKQQELRSEEHTSELQSRGLISYAVFCLKKYIKYDMLINTKKSNERSGYTKLWSITKRKSVS